MDTDYPLVSVIIPCFNHGRYLPEALDSIFSQTYPNIEIVVIDDGSIDDTRLVVENYQDLNYGQDLKYLYQINQGLSTARNIGIKNSRGDFLVFLDADDWLLPEAIATNISYLEQDEAFGFVSGGHVNVFTESGMTQSYVREVTSDHYYNLLQGDYIGMHGSVMYRRMVFDSYLFDTDLRACEDYDLYLRIARKFPVLHHTNLIASYRIHSPSMSSDHLLMLAGALRSLDKQSTLNRTEIKARKKGKRKLKKHYYSKMYHELASKIDEADKKKILEVFLTYPRPVFLQYSILRLKQAVKKKFPRSILRVLYAIGLYDNFSHPIRKNGIGDFRGE